MKVISWNCRGVGNARFLRFAKELCRVHRPDVCCFLETKASVDYVEDIPALLGFRHNFLVLSEGYAGGLWVLWNDNGFSAMVVQSSSQAIHLCIKENGKDIWLLSFAFVRPQRSFKEIFWKEMEQFSQQHDKSWIIMGDYNDFLLADEKSCGNVSSAWCRQFARWIEDCNLFDMGSSGFKYTWHGRLVGAQRLKMKLDRALMNIRVRHHFVDARVVVLPRLHSDHHALLLDTVAASPPLAARHFSCEAAWLDHE